MRKAIYQYIIDWEQRGYSSGIPDEGNQRLEQLHKIPSYRKIAIAILRNDVSLQSLGAGKKKSICYHTLKKIEIESRDNYVLSNQIKLF